MAMLESKGQLKVRKTIIEVEMTKMRTRERLLIHHSEESLRRGEALHRYEDPLHSSEPVDQSLKGVGYAAVKQPSPLRSEVPFPKRGLAEP